MELTLQEYQAGILERVKNFPPSTKPAWVEARSLLVEIDALARYGYAVGGMGVDEYAALVASTEPSWYSAEKSEDAANLVMREIDLMTGGKMTPIQIHILQGVMMPECEVIFRTLPDGFLKISFGAKCLAFFSMLDRVNGGVR